MANDFSAEQAFHCAADGMLIALVSFVNRFAPATARNMLEKMFFISKAGEKHTCLISAAMKGHERIVKLLCCKYCVNLEQIGCVKIDDEVVEGATALWAAAANGELGVVKILVKAGANINHRTASDSTPVRAACYNGRLDIVKYLLEHGADFSISNRYNSSCLIIASSKGYEDIVKLLLKSKADVNQTAHCGTSALACAAAGGYLSIVQELLEHGAEMTANKHGMTPLLSAAERCKFDVVEFLINHKSVTKKERIDALELLGASLANDKDNYNMSLCYAKLMEAMLLRYADPSNIMPKPAYMQPNPAYGYRKECQTIRELYAIRDDFEALQMESLIIKERILGRYNSNVSQTIVYRGAIFADHMQFDKCIPLWLYAIKLQQLNLLLIEKDLLRFSQVFSNMLNCQIPIDSNYIESVLKAALYNLQLLKSMAFRNVKHTKDILELQNKMENSLIHTLWIIVIAVKTMADFTEDEQYNIEKLIHDIINEEVTTKIGRSLLHLCVDCDTPVDPFYISYVCQFPCSLTTNVLIQLGADVNVSDDYKNTPLHIICGYNKCISPMNKFSSEFMALNSIIKSLVRAGAHIDAVNAVGETPCDVALSDITRTVLSACSLMSLKCLAAKSIERNQVPYVGIVPKHLESFMDIHRRRNVEECEKISLRWFRESFPFLDNYSSMLS